MAEVAGVAGVAEVKLGLRLEWCSPMLRSVIDCREGTGVQKDAADHESVHRILLDWADWQLAYRPRIGFPKRALGFACAGQVVTDDTAELLQDEATKHRCQVAEQCIDDLASADQQRAVHRHYLRSAYSAVAGSYEQVLASALSALAVAFRRKGILW